MKLKDLKNQHVIICNKYVSKFCKKQDMNFEGWAANIVGGIAHCNDFLFDFQDIILDINSGQKKGVIIDWYYQNIDNPKKNINYYSYTKGLRIDQIK